VSEWKLWKFFAKIHDCCDSVNTEGKENEKSFMSTSQDVQNTTFCFYMSRQINSRETNKYQTSERNSPMIIFHNWFNLAQIQNSKTLCQPSNRHTPFRKWLGKESLSNPQKIPQKQFQLILSRRNTKKSMTSYLDDEYCWTAEYSQLWVLHPSKRITADISSWEIEERRSITVLVNKLQK
jgi:hypothetical protein